MGYTDPTGLDAGFGGRQTTDAEMKAEHAALEEKYREGKRQRNSEPITGSSSSPSSGTKGNRVSSDYNGPPVSYDGGTLGERPPSSDEPTPEEMVKYDFYKALEDTMLDIADAGSNSSQPYYREKIQERKNQIKILAIAARAPELEKSIDNLSPTNPSEWYKLQTQFFNIGSNGAVCRDTFIKVELIPELIDYFGQMWVLTLAHGTQSSLKPSPLLKEPLPGYGEAARNIVNADYLFRAATTPGKGGASPVGRALQSHATRLVTAFSGATGNAAANTARGAQYLDNILANGTRTTATHPTFGDVIKVRLSNGTGAWWYSDGSFIGFLEPFTKQ